MLIVQVDFEVAPENLAVALDALRSERPVVKALDGNLGYLLLTDPDHAGKVTIVHHWDNPEALANYRTSDLLKSVGAKLFPLMVGKPQTLVWNATAVDTGS